MAGLGPFGPLHSPNLIVKNNKKFVSIFQGSKKFSASCDGEIGPRAGPGQKDF